MKLPSAPVRVRLIILLIILLGLFMYMTQHDLMLLPSSSGKIACTMDAKLCPDGSAVGRIPPRCDFAPCPGSR